MEVPVREDRHFFLCLYVRMARMCRVRVAYVAYHVRRKAVPLHRQIKREKMDIKSIIGLLVGGLFIWKYSKDSKAKITDMQQEFEDSQKQYLDYIDELEDRINPDNDNAERLPVEITADMRIGGGWLNQIEIVLHIKNVSEAEVELGDFRSRLTIGGYESQTVFPSNISTVKIPAGKTRDFILYKEDDYTFRGSHKEPYSALSMLAGKTDGTIPTNHIFPADQYAAELTFAFLWLWKGGKEECFVYNLPCKVTFMGNGWGVNYDWVGYNAGDQNHQKKNPSYWTQFDGEEIFSENE